MSDAANYSLVPTVGRDEHFHSKEMSMKDSRSILPRRRVARFILGLLACGVAVESGSAAVEPAQSAKVRYADLDLSRMAGAEELYRRIQVAARRTCDASITYHYLETAPARHACYRLTIADAVARANLAPLTAVHAEALRVAGPP
jgi:UrcA family protein